MEKFVLGLFLFYALAAVCRANSFKCYQCIPKLKGADSYSKDQCEKDQKEVDCNSTSAMPMTCMKLHGKRTDGKEVESRRCVPQEDCDEAKKVCDDKDAMEKAKIESCAVACCQTNLCNSAVATFAEVAIMMMGFLCVFMLV